MNIKPLKGYVVCKIAKNKKITIYNSDVQDAIHFTRGYAICLRNRLNEIYAYKKEEYFVRKAELRVIEEGSGMYLCCMCKGSHKTGQGCLYPNGKPIFSEFKETIDKLTKRYWAKYGKYGKGK